MSHYTVAVFTTKDQSVEDLLAPYDENMKVTPYVRNTKEEILKEIERYCDKDHDLKEKYSKLSDQEKIANWTGYEIFDKEGNPLTTYNPNSKWDWYVTGGRWSGLLKTKDGQQVDSCLVKDLELTPDKKEYDEAIRFWELVVEEQPLKDGEEKPLNWYKKEYYLERYGTKENYANKQCQLSTYAVLMPDGLWYEPGEMGWFGLSGATTDQEKEWDENYHKFFEQAEDDWTITIVDCHI